MRVGFVETEEEGCWESFDKPYKTIYQYVGAVRFRKGRNKPCISN